MEEFINGEIDNVLDYINEDRKKKIVLTDEQRETIFNNVVNGYDYIWEDLNNAICDEITEITK